MQRCFNVEVSDMTRSAEDMRRTVTRSLKKNAMTEDSADYLIPNTDISYRGSSQVKCITVTIN